MMEDITGDYSNKIVTLQHFPLFNIDIDTPLLTRFASESTLLDVPLLGSRIGDEHVCFLALYRWAQL